MRAAVSLPDVVQSGVEATDVAGSTLTRSIISDPTSSPHLQVQTRALGRGKLSRHGGLLHQDLLSLLLQRLPLLCPPSPHVRYHLQSLLLQDLRQLLEQPVDGVVGRVGELLQPLQLLGNGQVGGLQLGESTGNTSLDSLLTLEEDSLDLYRIISDILFLATDKGTTL